MSALSWFPDLIREARFFFGASSCPWGAVAIAICVTAISTFWFGFALGALVFSTRCRRFGWAFLQLLATLVIPEPTRDIRGRLAEYRAGL